MSRAWHGLPTPAGPGGEADLKFRVCVRQAGDHGRSLADELSRGSCLAVGLSLIALDAAWTLLAAGGIVPNRRVGLGSGAAIALIGGQQPLWYGQSPAWARGLTLAVALACIVVYRWESTLVLLAAGVLGVTVAVPEAIWEWTGGALSGALILIIAGAVLVLTGLLGVRLRRT